MRFFAPLLGALTLVPVSSVCAADAGRLWTGKVQALFNVQCVKCHRPIEQRGGLEPDTPQAVPKGGEDGPVVVPGYPEQSPLFLKLAAGADAHMPPKKQLTHGEQKLVREWIAAMALPADAAVAAVKTERRFSSAAEAVDVLVAEG